MGMTKTKIFKLNKGQVKMDNSGNNGQNNLNSEHTEPAVVEASKQEKVGQQEQAAAQQEKGERQSKTEQQEKTEQKTELKIEPKVDQPNYKDLFLRVSADLQNYQKRVEKQRAEWTAVAQESIILKLVPVIEDLDRALSSSVVSDQPAVVQWIDGLSVVQKNFKKALQELGVEEIPTSGAFNPELQEAVAQIDSVGHKSGQIVDVMSKGYRFKDKVIKYAQVVVAK